MVRLRAQQARQAPQRRFGQARAGLAIRRGVLVVELLTAQAHPGGEPFESTPAGAIGAEHLPEEGPEGHPGGVEDLLPSGPFVAEDLRDRGLGQDVVEAQLGLGSLVGGEAMDLEAEPGPAGEAAVNR